MQALNTYSAGLTVATQELLRIEKEGETAVKDWKNFLTASFNNVTRFAQEYLAAEGKHSYFELNTAIELNTAMTNGMKENALRHIRVFRGFA